MGVETPIPPKMITTAAPDGAPLRRIKTVEKNSWKKAEEQMTLNMIQPFARVFLESPLLKQREKKD